MIEKCAFLEAASAGIRAKQLPPVKSAKSTLNKPTQGQISAGQTKAGNYFYFLLMLPIANLSGGWGDNTKGEDIPDSKSSGGLSITTFQQVN